MGITGSLVFIIIWQVHLNDLPSHEFCRNQLENASAACEKMNDYISFLNSGYKADEEWTWFDSNGKQVIFGNKYLEKMYHSWPWENIGKWELHVRFHHQAGGWNTVLAVDRLAECIYIKEFWYTLTLATNPHADLRIKIINYHIAMSYVRKR